MSAGWQRSFTITSTTQVTVSFRYRMDQTHTYLNDEYSQVLVSIDGALVGTMGNDYLVQLTGDGQAGVGQIRTTEWQWISLDLGTLSPGPHTCLLYTSPSPRD